MADLTNRRIALAKRRLTNILTKHSVATMRTLEQKISDAGPTNQRIDPHLLTKAHLELEREGKLVRLQRAKSHWFHLAETNENAVRQRLQVLEPIHDATLEGNFVRRLGQALEIPVFKALQGQTKLHFLGAFTDLSDHDDSSLYRKEEHPEYVNGLSMPQKKKLDFLIFRGEVVAGIEVKNTRPWVYPDSEEVVELIAKCCAINAVPILIARRIHYATFSVLSNCGVILHQTYNQRYPKADEQLAALARDKNLLGYHDIRLGNDPDVRLIKFIHTNLPGLLDRFRESFENFMDLLRAYAQREMGYREFAGRSKRRLRGEPEDLPPFEAPDEGEGGDDWI
jgi:hypothetical protein